MTLLHDPATTVVDLHSLHPDHAAALRTLVSSAWHGVWAFTFSSPWVAIALMVPAVALLVRCTRLTLRRG